MEAIGAGVRLAHSTFIKPRLNTQLKCQVIKAGTFARTVVWPCFVPLAMYQWIRAKDRDCYALELLTYRSNTQNPEEFYDPKMGPVLGHWRIKRDMEVIYRGTHTSTA